MSIFRKRYKRYSQVTVAIEADNKDDAQKIFDDWLEDEKEDFNELLSERETDEEDWLVGFANIDLYNRSPIIDDYLITEPDNKPSEERRKYNVYVTYKDNPGNRAIYYNCQIDKVLDVISELDANYSVTAKSAKLNIKGQIDIWIYAERRKT